MRDDERAVRLQHVAIAVAVAERAAKGRGDDQETESSAFVPLTPNAPIPVNSDLDTQGTSQVTISADVTEGTQPSRATATISSGTAKILGPSELYPDKLAIRPISRTSPRCGHIVAAAAQAGSKKRRKTTKKKTGVLKTKVVKAAGPVEIITRDIIAAALGTSWTTTQTCTGTRVSVTEGVVKVLDRSRRKPSRASAGKTSFFDKRR